jgi:hypothetical protein
MKSAVLALALLAAFAHAQLATMNVIGQQPPITDLVTFDKALSPSGQPWPFVFPVPSNQSFTVYAANYEPIDDAGEEGIAVLFYDMDPTPTNPPVPHPPQKTAKFNLCEGHTVTLYSDSGLAQLYVPPMCGGQWATKSSGPGIDNLKISFWSTIADGVPANFTSHAFLQTFTANKRRILSLNFVVSRLS